MLPVLPPFLLGVLVAPLAKRVVKPLMRGAVKTSMSLAYDIRRAAHEASEEIHDVAAEVTAESFAAEAAEFVEGSAAERAAAAKPEVKGRPVTAKTR